MSLGKSLEGTQSKSTSNSEKTQATSSSGTQTESLEISDEAVDQIIADVLGGTDGLASIFSGEQNAGIFNSSVSAQAAGDLSAKLVGEIAKLRAKKVTQTDSEEDILAIGSSVERSRGVTAGVESSFDLSSFI